ncbi:MAG: sugar phosphate isomerase/epimerase [Candidatus Acidiferrales bacterium]
MNHISRREFVKIASACAAGVAIGGSVPELMANPLGLPLGLQLYSVRDQLPKDYQGTLRQLGVMGYREVEAAGFFGRSASDVKQIMQQTGLHCVSAHYPMADLLPHLDEVIQYGKDLGLEYMVCSSPALPDLTRAKPAEARANREAMTLDDWRWNANRFNSIGERVNAAGMRFGYHNHTTEFRTLEGVVIYDELLRLTDPAKVTMEMDCGWVVVAGKNPVDYLTRYPTRFSMLHIKDFKLTGAPATDAEPPPSTELGRGSIDYRLIFQAAKKAAIKHSFIEQEHFDMPPMEALKIDADYMRALKV